MVRTSPLGSEAVPLFPLLVPSSPAAVRWLLLSPPSSYPVSASARAVRLTQASPYHQAAPQTLSPMLFPVLLCCMPACTYSNPSIFFKCMSNLRWILLAEMYVIAYPKPRYTMQLLHPVISDLPCECSGLLQHCYHLLFSHLSSLRRKYPEFSCHFPSSFASFLWLPGPWVQDFLSLLPKCQLCSHI